MQRVAVPPTRPPKMTKPATRLATLCSPTGGGGVLWSSELSCRRQRPEALAAARRAWTMDMAMTQTMLVWSDDNPSSCTPRASLVMCRTPPRSALRALPRRGLSLTTSRGVGDDGMQLRFAARIAGSSDDSDVAVLGQSAYLRARSSEHLRAKSCFHGHRRQTNSPTRARRGWTGVAAYAGHSRRRL